MLIGIISDSHDDMQMIKKAVEFFNDNGVGHVLHAGDMVSPFTFEIFSELKCPFNGIFGNNDGDRVVLREKSEGKVNIQPATFTIGGIKIAMVHEPIVVDSLAHSGHYDVVIHGHTHVPYIKTDGALIINPGKSARLHKGKATIALLNTETLKAELITLDE